MPTYGISVQCGLEGLCRQRLRVVYVGFIMHLHIPQPISPGMVMLDLLSLLASRMPHLHAWGQHSLSTYRRIIILDLQLAVIVQVVPSPLQLVIDG